MYQWRASRVRGGPESIRPISSCNTSAPRMLFGDVRAGEAAVRPVRAPEVGQGAHDGRAARTHDASKFLHQVAHARVAADAQDLHQPEAVGGVGGRVGQRQARGVRAHAQHVGALPALLERASASTSMATTRTPGKSASAPVSGPVPHPRSRTIRGSRVRMTIRPRLITEMVFMA